MQSNEIIAKVKSLGLPDNSYVLLGSCPLALAGIRETGDIDMLVSNDAFEILLGEGWQEAEGRRGDRILTHDVFDAHTTWEFDSFEQTLEQLLSTAAIIDGVPFASLEDTLLWKAAAGRPKDLADIKLINSYLAGEYLDKQ